MCGRFSQLYTWEQIHAFSQPLTLNEGVRINLQPRYNIAPTDQVDVIRLRKEGDLELVRMRWWLVPAWWKKSLKEVPATFNARVETVATASMFKDAFAKRRCLIPASGFFEWTGPKEARLPWFISSPDGLPLAFAGLWDRWKNPEGEWIESCTIIVGPANAFMGEIHDRMPVIVPQEHWLDWLTGKAGAEILVPAEEDKLRKWRVTPRMNSSRYQEPDAVEPVWENDV